MLLHEKLKDKRILLASKSPRRQELLKGLGLNFEIVSIQSDEDYPKDLRGAEITEFISLEKSLAYSDLKANEILITADTIVWLGDEKIGKPKGAEDAFNMLSKLSGKVHYVFTSVTIRSLNKTLTFSDVTEVEFDEFSKEEINYYISEYKPFDKAGSYGIQEWPGYAKVAGINGSYFNVMGLPVRKLYRALQEF